MPRRRQADRSLTLAALLLSLLAGLLPAQTTAPLPRDGAFAGKDECNRCHERQHKRLLSGSHGAVLDVPALQGCETCHGPGARHGEAKDPDPALITLPPLLAPAGQTALCRRCHQDQIEHHGGDPAGFRAAGLSCTDCHAIHGRKDPPPLPGVVFHRRSDAVATAQPVGSGRCIDCHPLRDATLAASPHHSLAAAQNATGCETCHGNGALHAEGGAGRLITRPDRAADGVVTCRSCHAEIDATEFHWRGRQKPYLSADITCTTCHRIHQGAAPPTDQGATNRRCAGCHSSAFATMPGSMHQALGGLDAPLPQGCGSCHPGALAHAEAGGRAALLVPWRGAAKAEAAVCLACHRSDAALQHVQGGSHLRQGVTCTQCHGPLHGQQRSQVAARAESRCAGCHADVAAQFRQPNHHPVPEARMRCGSCHDVHGARPRVTDLQLREAVCVGCHARYRGPFVFAHQAQRRNGCVVCHLPHGSPNRRLLQQANTQQNCLQCHGDFPVFHDQTPGAVFTVCIRCHTEVHGSNHARYLLR